MEIPVINRITGDFDININSLQNPSFLSQILAVSGSGIEQLYRQRYNFVTWGALIIALLASVTTIINRFKLLVIKLRHHRSLYRQPLLNDDAEDDFDDSDSDASCSSSDDEEEEEEEEEENNGDENFRTKGQNGNFSSLRRRRNGKSVMKFWDNLGFNFSSDNLIALYDSVSFNGRRRDSPVLETGNMVVKATADSNGGVSLRGWDTRAASKIPSILAEWRPKTKLLEKVNIVGVGRVHKFFVTDDVTSELTVGDIRNVSSPLVDLTEADMDDIWWDAGDDDVAESVTRL